MLAACVSPGMISMPRFVDELLARVSLANVIGQRLTWDSRKSRPANGDYWACCPFHQEKTPSFHVDDQKGLYYCFGCQESGNALTFLRKTDNLEFREAVQILADSVGMEVPASGWKDAAAEASRKSLHDICELAARHFQIALNSRAGSAARAYLSERGVSADAVKQFEIGFAANKRDGLTRSFTGKGISPETLQEAGLSALPDDGGPPYDRFRNRIVFPIRDLRGQLTGFGGRSLDPSARAKYLNSPETSIFKKGASLYNHRHARAALKEGSDLVVAEGYMDVIALSQAGMKACVAPLGTAITETQLMMLWKLAHEPVLALDGDRAGLNAAQRASKLALPALEPGKSLRFCFLPDGADPDDFIREHGAQAMRELISRAIPLADFIWQTEIDRHRLDTPERSAAFETNIRAMAATIRDLTVRRTYSQLIRERLFELSRRPRERSSGISRQQTFAGPSPELRASLLVSGRRQEGIDLFIRESAILGICLTVPEIIERFPERLENLEFANSSHQRLLDCIIGGAGSPGQDPKEFRAMVREECGSEAVDRLMASSRLLPLRSSASGGSDGHDGEFAKRAEMMLLEELEKIEAVSAARRELEDALVDAKQGAGDDPIKRFGEAVRARLQAQRGIQPAKARGYITADNGVSIDPQELEDFDRLVQGMNSKE